MFYKLRLHNFKIFQREEKKKNLARIFPIRGIRIREGQEKSPKKSHYRGVREFKLINSQYKECQDFSLATLFPDIPNDEEKYKNRPGNSISRFYTFLESWNIARAAKPIRLI